MINCSHLKYPPIKQKAIPKFLIYEHPEKTRDMNSCCKIFSTKNGKLYGEMEYIKSRFIHNCRSVQAIYVEYLESKIKNKGAGTALLNFITNKSKQEGLKGRFYLCATALPNHKRAPYLFYRKFGMTTLNMQIDKQLDSFIINGQKATEKDFSPMLFYYIPEIAKKQHSSMRQKITACIIRYLANMYDINIVGLQ